jgi:hypothetical protein
MLGQGAFQVALAADVGDPDEVEDIRIAGSLLGQIRICGWQGVGEVGDGLAGPFVELGVDLVNQDVAAPAPFNSLLCVP